MPVTEKDISKFTKPSSIGGIEQSITDKLYGIGMNESLEHMPVNEDVSGYTFFIKPQLNLSTDNIKRHSKLAQLLTKEDGIHRFVRCTLDPHLNYKDIVNGEEVKGVTSALVDRNSPFISILTNTLESISGWPDPVLPTYISPAGVRKEQYGFVDGVRDILNNFTLDMNNRNIAQDPITLLLDMWETYMSATFANDRVAPYPAMIVNKEYDFNTRVYRFILAIDGRTIRKVGLTGASFPVNIAMGKFFDTSIDTTLRTQSASINTRLESFGALYNDYEYMHSFNLTVAAFNHEAAKIIFNSPPFVENPGAIKESNLVRVPTNLYKHFKYRLTPIINLVSMTLDFYIDSHTLDVELKQTEEEKGEQSYA